MARVDHYLEAEPPVANSIVVAVSAFVLDNEDQVLMIRRTDNNLYSIPSGDVRLGETPAQAAVRVTRAETGVDVQVTGLVGIYSDPQHVITYDNGEARQEFSICFAARYVTGDTHVGLESTEVLWVDQPVLPELTIHPSIRLRIQHGLDERSSPYYS